MTRKTIQCLSAVTLTLLFTGTYFALRAIPISECKFLHYEPLSTETAGEDELCNVAPVPFVDVVNAPFPVGIEVVSLTPTSDGEMELQFTLLDPAGDPILPHELAITHTRKIHLMLIDETLDSYHHLHPQPLGDSGDYRVRFTPRSSHYRFFAEFVPLRTRQISVADGSFELQPESIQAERDETPISFELEGSEQPLRANRDHKLKLKLTNEEADTPLPLEKTMDAYAHLVGFEDSLSGYAHMHPLTVDPEIGESAEMEFLFHPTRSGNFRIWVQIRSNGEDLFRPFDVQVL